MREEIVFLRNKVDIVLSNQVNNSHTHNVSQYSSNTEYNENDNIHSDFHQQDRTETVINTIPEHSLRTKKRKISLLKVTKLS